MPERSHATTVPFQTNSGNPWRQWYTSRPDLFTREFVPFRTVVFGSLAAVGVVGALLVSLYPGSIAEAFTGRPNANVQTLLMLAAVPIIATVLGAFGLVKLSRRWRVRDRGVLRPAAMRTLPAHTDLSRVLRELRASAGDADDFVRTFHSLPNESRGPFWLVVFATEERNAVIVFGMKRFDRRRDRTNARWSVEHEPLVFLDHEAFDAIDALQAFAPRPEEG
ncbi:hypothetical protein [Humidisolicoccus flavus]|uniref:hypothetical protein n=1 Tax=Humidisolicoccus flavus TaxID=3111414 RepID=UPI003246ED5B